mmetsp:Transcript_15412/g.31161  ORF Transcript_15412/g.31161 Transcript_15412/m.31161 type:complete len:217 (-) Transcript_15412:517-1167(-)
MPTEPTTRRRITGFLLFAASACMSGLSVEATSRPDSSTTRGRIRNNGAVLHTRPDSDSADASFAPSLCPLRASSNDNYTSVGSGRVIDLQKKPSSASRSLLVSPAAAAFIDPSPLRFRTSPPFLRSSSSVFTPHMSQSSSDEGGIVAVDERNDNGDSVKVGSSDYYKGFVSRSVEEEPKERISGDALLGPTLKFAGGVSVILLLLTVAFLTSNGII